MPYITDLARGRRYQVGKGFARQYRKIGTLYTLRQEEILLLSIRRLSRVRPEEVPHDDLFHLWDNEPTLAKPPPRFSRYDFHPNWPSNRQYK